MPTAKLWVSYTTDRFEQTVAFYRDTLELRMGGGWDRGPGDRGSCFYAANGLIELMERSADRDSDLLSSKPPQGVNIQIEVDEVKMWYERIKARGVKMRHDYEAFAWGEQGFSFEDPNGVVIYISSITEH